MKSFSRQISELFSFAGYKSNARLLPCTVTYSPFKTHPKLTYKCDIALRLYDDYKKDGFKFSEKGVTPKSIAEQIQLFVHSSKDYTTSIDSFGYFHVTPSSDYLERLEEQIQESNAIGHAEVVAQGLAKENWHSQNKMYIFMPMETFTLSSMRIAYYLGILKKKYRLFKQYKPEKLVTVMDFKGLSQQDITLMIRLGIVNGTFKSVNSSLGKRLLIESVQKLKQLVIGPRDEIISGTLRHNYIPFLNQYKPLINQENSEVMTFGDIIPNVSINQISRVESNFIPKILNQSLKFDKKVPINLNGELHTFQRPLELLQQMKNRVNSEKLLILLDYLQDNKIVELLSVKTTDICKNDYKPFAVLYNQLNLIL